MEYTVSDIKKNNTVKVFQAFRKSAPITRRDAEKLTGLSWGNVYAVCERLLKGGFLVAQKENRGDGGRPPEILNVAPLTRLSLGIDINSIGIELDLVNLSGNIIYSKSLPAPSRDGQELLNVILAQTEDILSKYDSIIGINLSMQGKINRRTGVSLRTNFFENWENVPLVEIFENKFSVPTFLYHDPECLLAYHLHTDNRLNSLRNVIIVRVDEGIGFARTNGDTVSEPTDVNTVELGHTLVVPGGKKCVCGKCGCLEAYSSLRGMKSSFYEQTGISTDDITKYILDGNEKAKEIENTATECLGIALSNLFTLFAPDAVLLDGVAFKRLPHLFDKVKTSVDSLFGETCNLIKANHSQAAAAVGASLRTVENSLEAILFDDTLRSV